MSDHAEMSAAHRHVFLAADHARSERRTWWVIWLCGAMMVAEIVGGWLFGSIALVADGLHMSTHAGALLLAAMAYRYARRHADDPRFSFGTGKLGDLAGFASAIVLAMISLLIAYEAISRFFTPVPIDYAEAIPIACLGLGVNVLSAIILAGGGHDHGHHHGHHHHDHHDHHEHDDHEEAHRITTRNGTVLLRVFEDDTPPHFRVYPEDGIALSADHTRIETLRPDGSRQVFGLEHRGPYLESTDQIPEPHEFVAHLAIDGETHEARFAEHEHAHGAAARDNNMRAAVVHVMADAAVSVLVIIGLVLARGFGWLWMDPLVGIVGAVVIASWALGLVRDTAKILLDMIPDSAMQDKLRATIEASGDQLDDLHLWRLGPGHFGAILSVRTEHPRTVAYYRGQLSRFKSLSHLTVEIHKV
jgi:cation diffusion facilitator family transporter